MEGGDLVFVLGADAQAVQLAVEHLVAEGPYALARPGELRVDLGLGPAGRQDLGPVVAHIGDRPDRDHPPSDRGAAPAHAGDDPVAPADGDQLRTRDLGHVGVVRMADDGGERPVDVEQDGRPRRVGAHDFERLGEHHGRGHAP